MSVDNNNKAKQAYNQTGVNEKKEKNNKNKLNNTENK